jgi:hypothetical protein
MLVSEFDDVNFNLKTGIKARYNIFMRNLADFLKRKLCNFPNIPFIDTQDFHGPRRQVTTLLLCKHFFRLLWKQSWAQRFELESDAFHFTQKEGRFNKTLIVLKLKGLFRPPPRLHMWIVFVKLPRETFLNITVHYDGMMDVTEKQKISISSFFFT